MVREILSHHYTTTYQISLTYLKRQNVIAQTQKHLTNINYLTLKSKVKLRSRWNMIIHLHTKYKPSKFSMDKDLNLRRLNPFKTNINIVRHNFKNQSQQTDLRKYFPGETYTTTSNTMNQLLRENNT